MGGDLSNEPQSYLQRALKNQGLDKIPNNLKEVWNEEIINILFEFMLEILNTQMPVRYIGCQDKEYF